MQRIKLTIICILTLTLIGSIGVLSMGDDTNGGPARTDQATVNVDILDMYSLWVPETSNSIDLDLTDYPGGGIDPADGSAIGSVKIFSNVGTKLKVQLPSGNNIPNNTKFYVVGKPQNNWQRGTHSGIGQGSVGAYTPTEGKVVTWDKGGGDYDSSEPHDDDGELLVDNISKAKTTRSIDIGYGIMVSADGTLPNPGAGTTFNLNLIIEPNS